MKISQWNTKMASKQLQAAAQIVQEPDALYSGCPSDTSRIGREKVCEGCPGREMCLQFSGQDAEQKYIDIRMNAVKRKILVLSGKGGVGKSSIACNLAIALTRLSKKVGVADLDICGPSVPSMMGVDGGKIISTSYGWQPLTSPHGGVKVMSVGSLLEDQDLAVVWRGPRKTAVVKRFLKDTFWGRLDYLIFDTPPGTSDEHLTVTKLLMTAKPEGVVIVTTPQEVALATIRKEIDFCRKMNLPIIGIIENMSGYMCPCCQEWSDVFGEIGGTEKLAKEYDISFLGKIPLDPNLVECCERGESVFSKAPHTSSVNALKILAWSLDSKDTSIA